jgi:hypothetical protein
VQVIVFTNSNGGVSVCVPTGELSIQETQTKDTPSGSVIIDDSTLPQGDDAQFFNSWVLNGTTVTVNQTKAQTQAVSILDQITYSEAQHRLSKVGSGLTNVLSDTDWLALIATAKSAINTSSNTSALLSSIAPVQNAITANA